MKQYRIAKHVISVGALGNKIFYSEDKGVYPETCWRPGEADELVSKGFLEVYSDKKIRDINDITVKELKEFLTEQKIEFKKNASKEDLYRDYLSK